MYNMYRCATLPFNHCPHFSLSFSKRFSLLIWFGLCFVFGNNSCMTLIQEVEIIPYQNFLRGLSKAKFNKVLV